MLQEWEAPDIHQVAMALARKYNWTIAPSGNTALNALGLSTQIPVKWMYISDGRYIQYDIVGTALEFKHRANGTISGMSMKIATIIQAMGKGKTTQNWVYQVIREIAETA